MKFKLIVISALLVGVILCDLKFQKLEDFKIRNNGNSTSIRSFLISEANMILILSNEYIIAYDMKTLNHLAKELTTSFLVNNISMQLFKLILDRQSISNSTQCLSPKNNKSKSWFTHSSVLQLRFIILNSKSLLNQLNLKSNQDLEIREDQEGRNDGENINKTIYILESHAQVQQRQVYLQNLQILKYDSSSKRIIGKCNISVKSEKEDLNLECNNQYQNNEIQVELDLSGTYYFQKVEMNTHILFFNNFDIVLLQDNSRISYISMTKKYEQIEQQEMKPEEFSKLNFLRMINYSIQDIYFLYADRFGIENVNFSVLKYNLENDKILNFSSFLSFSQVTEFQYQKKTEQFPYFNIDVMFYNKKIIIQWNRFVKQIDIEELFKTNQVQQYNIASHNITIFQEKSQFLELSFNHEGQIIPFILAKSKEQNDTYSLYSQACQDRSDIYFASEFSCKKQSCQSHLLYQSEFPLNQEVCVLFEIPKEKKSNTLWFKYPFSIVSSIFLIIFIKKVYCWVKPYLPKLRFFKIRNSADNQNLLSKNIEIVGGDDEKKEQDIPQVIILQDSEQEEVLGKSETQIEPSGSERENSNLKSNLKISELKGSQESDQRLNSNQDYQFEGHTPIDEKGDFRHLIQKKNTTGLQSSYYNNSQLYIKQIQQEKNQKKEEMLRIIKQQKEQKEKLLLEKKNKTQYIQQSKSAQQLQDQKYNYQEQNIPLQVLPQGNQIQYYNQANQFDNNFNQKNHIQYPKDQYFYPNNINNYKQNDNQNPPFYPLNMLKSNSNQNHKQFEIQQQLPQQLYEPNKKRDFDIGQSNYIQPSRKIQMNQVNEQVNVNNQNNKKLNNLNNNDNQNLQITQQLKFFQWALDQQFGFNQLNQNPLSHIIGDEFLKSSKQSLQQNLDNHNLNESQNKFQQLLEMELGGNQISDKKFILSQSQIEKLSQSLHQQYEEFKFSNILKFEKKSETEVFQMFIQDELKSDLKVDEENEFFQKKLQLLKEDSLPSLQNQASSEQSIQEYCKILEEEEEKQNNENNKYNKIKLGGNKKQISLQNLDDLEEEQLNIQPNQNLSEKTILNNINIQQNHHQINHPLQKQENQPNINEAKLCQICYVNNKNCVYKCGHSYCYPCAEDIQKKFGKCSFCNLEIEILIRLYD